ncbi:MAG: GNAT family N-acetyltransferase [Bacteroidetes bacterium]|nr:GNAT family N-acetyltransferase [Bacteroidota bacterium]
MEIRRITTEEDIDTCAELMNISDPWITLQFDKQRCLMSLKGDYKELYGAYIDGNVAGFVIIQLYGTLRGYIQTVCVKEQYRGKGIGTALLKYIEERIYEVSPNAFICVSSFNPEAHKLYTRMGFEYVGTLKDHFIRGYDEIILRKSKGPFAEFVAVK